MPSPLLCIVQAIKSAGDDVEGEDPDAIAAEIKQLDTAIAQRQTRLDELEKNKKWNWENMCHVVGESDVLIASLGYTNGDHYNPV